MEKEKICGLAEKYYPAVKELRHELHQNPELSWQEFWTSEKICEELEKIGIPYEKGYGNETNVAAWINGEGEGVDKTILLRADMDALPIQEESGYEFPSKNDGIMHACGHDGHVAGLLGAAHILYDLRKDFSGTIKLAFEAAEENGGGAKDFIQKGFLNDVEAVFGCHLFGTVKEGKVGIRVGNFMSASDAVYIKIHGVSGHASTPHLAIDPVNIAAQFITDAQAIVARTVPPTQIAVLSFCRIQGGTAFNIIPDEVELAGSLRCFDENIRKKIHDGIEGLLKGLTENYGATYEIHYENSLPAVINDEKLTLLAADSMTKIMGKGNVDFLTDPNMGSESFAWYREKAPSCFYYLGIDAGDKLPKGHNLHHNGKFCWHDKNLKTSMELLAQIALDYMEKEKDK